MKKPADADIRNLFRRFGGDAGNYQEIQQEYVDDKAKQSWPIVEAMERERARAPTLRSAAAQQAVAAPVSKPVSPAVTRPAPVAEAVRPAKQAGSLSALFSKPESTPVRSLFSRPAPPTHPTPPVQPLFAALNPSVGSKSSQEKSGSLSARNQPVQARHPENAPLNAVFSRLIKPQSPVNTRAPENGLRNMLGFLKK